MYFFLDEREVLISTRNLIRLGFTKFPRVVLAFLEFYFIAWIRAYLHRISATNWLSVIKAEIETNLLRSWNFFSFFLIFIAVLETYSSPALERRFISAVIFFCCVSVDGGCDEWFDFMLKFQSGVFFCVPFIRDVKRVLKSFYCPPRFCLLRRWCDVSNGVL